MYPNIIVVSNRHLCSIPFPMQMEHVLRKCPKALILREKDLTEQEYYSLAREIMPICERYHVPCIFHTYIHVARELGSSMIHVPLPILRNYAGQLDDFSVIGTSVHSVEDALEAYKLGATYLIAGHIFATDCKKGIPPRGTSFLSAVCETVTLPVYAIGGIDIDSDKLSQIMQCGAVGGCIMSSAMKATF